MNEKTKRFPLFAGNGDRKGGWMDFKGDFDSCAEAIIKAGRSKWWHVVDLESRKVYISGKKILYRPRGRPK